MRCHKPSLARAKASHHARGVACAWRVRAQVHDAHFTQLVQQYGNVVAINLVNQHGTGERLLRG